MKVPVRVIKICKHKLVAGAVSIVIEREICYTLKYTPNALYTIPAYIHIPLNPSTIQLPNRLITSEFLPITILSSSNIQARSFFRPRRNRSLVILRWCRPYMILLRP